MLFIQFFNLAASSTTIEKKRMSRRQRKNVKKREKESDSNTSSTPNPTVCTPDPNVTSTKNQKKRNSLPSKFHVSLGLSDDQIYYHLLNYILDQDTLRSLGMKILRLRELFATH